MKTFLLVYPTQITEAPMTLAMLAAVLKQEGWNVHTLVNTFRRPLSIADVVRKAHEVCADFVGVSMLTFQVLQTYRMVSALRSFGFKVVLGGPHPTDCPMEGLEAGAHYVIQGEGEGALRDLVRGTLMPGIVPKRPRLDVRTLPLPDLSVFDRELFTEDGFVKGFHRVYTSRGCPGACTFCDWKVFGQKFSEYNIEEVAREVIRRHKEYGIESFSIADDCFTVNRGRVFEFCQLLEGRGIKWRANSRANLVDKAMLQAMKDSGCHSIAFGLESGDPETLRRIGKGVTLSDNITACKLAHDAGLEVYGCLMTGFPWETPENVANQIKFIRTVWDDVTLFQVSGSLMPFPGAAIYTQYAKKYGFEKYWLREEYQNFGIQVYQNAENPYAVSTLYQRLFFDDTYIRNEHFFRYSPEYKRSVRELVKLIGRHNLRHMFYGRPIARRFWTTAADLSMLVAQTFPSVETRLVGTFAHGRSAVEQLRDKRRGIAKSYTNPN